jgi:nicotinate phosphoribosyltransferase
MMRTALSTDLYEVTMAAGYVASGWTGRATFELFVRDLPPNRGFLVAAGLEQALAWLEHLRFTPEEIDYLRGVPALRGAPAAFFDEYLPAFRFTGEVWAMPEGTPVFAMEPLLRVTAPIAEAQLVETALLAIVMFQTAIASKAARVVEAAAGRPVIEFGSRRAHGVEAALYAARAAYLGGCEGTSNLEAGYRFGIPVSGTMAHSWVMAHGDEMEAFRHFVSLYGERSVLLLDTYDALEAARRVAASDLRPAAVRLDSGDIVALSRAVRALLDAGGKHGTRIFVSGDLDEYRIAALVEAGAVVDGFGVGTALSTSSDAPALGGIYKLVEVERGAQPVPVMKLSPGKRTYPARKQVWRVMVDGALVRDIVAVADEPGPRNATPLLECVMREGRRLAPSPPLADLRERSRDQIRRLPPEVRRLRDAAPFPVQMSETLETLVERLSGEAVG